MCRLEHLAQGFPNFSPLQLCLARRQASQGLWRSWTFVDFTGPMLRLVEPLHRPELTASQPSAAASSDEDPSATASGDEDPSAAASGDEDRVFARWPRDA